MVARALGAFNRTLALDPTFHLAYSHVVDLYQQLARPASPLVLDGDTLRLLPNEAAVRAFGDARLSAARRRARELAERDARAWAATDPVPQAFVALATTFLPLGHFDSAAAVLAAGHARTRAAGANELPFIRAQVLTHVDPAVAHAALGAALREADAAALRATGGPDRFPFILASASAAGAAGDVRGVQAVARLAAAVQRTPYNSPLGTEPTARWWAALELLVMGVPAPSLRATSDEGIAAIDRLPDGWATSLGGQSLAVPYLAYAVTREPRYAATLRRWSAAAKSPPYGEIDALEALAAGDSARARNLARGFPLPDTARTAGGRVYAGRWVVRAEVLAALGDLRGALAMYEVLDPRRIVDAGYLDPGMVLYARSFLARGRLYEELGDHDLAAAAYGRFLTLWRDADPSLQDQVRAARAGLLRARERRAGEPIRRNRFGGMGATE